MNQFTLDVYDVVKKIPKGRVASYGQVAAMAGSPGAARAVGNILHKNPWPIEVPCHRVVHADGRLAPAFAFGGQGRQRELLIMEGVSVVNYCVDMSKYQYKCACKNKT